MNSACPICAPSELEASGLRSTIRFGTFWRKSDGREVQRFRCQRCGKGFSLATGHPCYRQNKRHLNEPLRKFYNSGVSQRRLARNFRISRTTVVRKFLFLAGLAIQELFAMNQELKPATEIEFDDLETFEHTKCKPLSVTLAVESKTRRILGFAVAQMPAKGVLASLARKKYGFRKDERGPARRKLLRELKPIVDSRALIKSDQNPHYPSDVRRAFPHARHQVFHGKRGCITGQGELKKIGFDPLFSLNHTCAMLRDNLKRLSRRTWCTTKRPDRLAAQIALYAVYHNAELI